LIQTANKSLDHNAMTGAVLGWGFVGFSHGVGQLERSAEKNHNIQWLPHRPMLRENYRSCIGVGRIDLPAAWTIGSSRIVS